MSLKRRKLGRLAAARRRDLFFALGEPTRRSLIELIAPGEQPLSHLAKFFPSSRQSVLDHLHILQKAGLVSARFAGKRRYYRLRNAGLRQVRAWLSHYEELWHRGAQDSGRPRRESLKKRYPGSGLMIPVKMNRGVGLRRASRCDGRFEPMLNPREPSSSRRCARPSRAIGMESLKAGVGHPL